MLTLTEMLSKLTMPKSSVIILEQKGSLFRLGVLDLEKDWYDEYSNNQHPRESGFEDYVNDVENEQYFYFCQDAEVKSGGCTLEHFIAYIREDMTSSMEKVQI